jgi:hypothetical protein
MERKLYITPSDAIPSLPDSNELLLEALENIVAEYPPQQSYGEPLKGLWNGPTGIAYLFLNVSASRPDIVIASKSALFWAKEYLSGERDPNFMVLQQGDRCGVTSELLAYQAVQAAVSKDLAYVKAFLESIPLILSGGFEAEWLRGRAGTLYLIRLIRHWLPGSSHLLEDATKDICESLLVDGPDWTFYNARYIGAVHGDIGIITQIVLTSPKASSDERVRKKLSQLLSLQQSDGNWTTQEKADHSKPYVQFCHGAPGFLTSLRSLQPYFPEAKDAINRAIHAANEIVWREGLLGKEPNLCHGAFGNSL